MTKLQFKLVRPAKSSGGDRYEYLSKGQEGWMVVYVPQNISRKDGEIKQELTITIE